MLRVINHVTGDETEFESTEAFEKVLAGDKLTKGSVKWHAERGQEPHYSVYDGDKLVSRVVAGKVQNIPKVVSTADIAGAGAALEQKVETLEYVVNELNNKLDDLSGQVSKLTEDKVETLEQSVNELSNKLDDLSGQVSKLTEDAAGWASQFESRQQQKHK